MKWFKTKGIERGDPSQLKYNINQLRIKQVVAQQ